MHIKIWAHHQFDVVTPFKWALKYNKIIHTFFSLFTIVDQMSIVASVTSPCVPLDGLKPNGVYIMVHPEESTTSDNDESLVDGNH